MDDEQVIASQLLSAISKCKQPYLKMLFEHDAIKIVIDLLLPFEFECKPCSMYGEQFYEVTIKIK